MKRILYILLAVAASVSACKKDNLTEVPNDGSSEMRFRVTAVSPAVETPISWEAVSDRIGVYARKSGSDEYLNENAYYDAFSSTPRSRFEPLKDSFRMYWAEGESYDISLYYPYRASMKHPESVPVSIGAEQELPAGSYIEYLKKTMLFTQSLKGVKMPEDGTLDMELSPITAFVRVCIESNIPVSCSRVTIAGEPGTVLAFEDGSYDMISSALETGEKVSSSVTVKPVSPVSVNRSKAEFWARVNPGYAGGKLTIDCDIEGAEFEKMTVDVPDGGLRAGVCASYDVVLSAESVNLSDRGTANTYIVSAPGLYSFRADVKGNGVPRSFSWSFDGEPVSKGYDVSIVPSSAALLWYSSPKTAEGFPQVSPVESVSFDPAGGMVYFRVPKDFIDGNAVIAVFDEGGEILWSWNIWAVKDYDADAAARTVGRYVMMDRNLGAVLGTSAKGISDGTAAAAAIGNYYQWGRKDPFPAASEYTDASSEIAEGWGNEAYTDIEACKVTGNRIFSDDRTQNGRMLSRELGSGYSLESAVEESVKYPHKWMFGGSSDAVYPQYSWFTGDGDFYSKSLQERDEWRFLWGSLDNISSEKTIYDPCPAGWKVPTADVYATLFENPVQMNHGLYLPQFDLYFPYAGQRKAGFGGSVIVGGSEIMLASASVANSVAPLRASAVAGGGVRLTGGNSYIGAGLQVRCVREEVSSAAPSYGDQSGHTAALMGDSITRTWRDRGRPAFFTENNYLNKGIDGTTSSNMIGRFASDILSDDPLVTVIACGTNDFAENDGNYVSREDLLANIALMARMAVDQGSAVVLGSMLPSRSMWWKSDSWKAMYDGDWIAGKIVAGNRLIKAYAAANGFGYADYHTPLKNEENGLADRYCWVFGNNPDGSLNLDSVHPNYDAFLVMEGILKPLIAGALYDPAESHPGGGNIDDLDKWEWK